MSQQPFDTGYMFILATGMARRKQLIKPVKSYIAVTKTIILLSQSLMLWYFPCIGKSTWHHFVLLDTNYNHTWISDVTAFQSFPVEFKWMLRLCIPLYLNWLHDNMHYWSMAIWYLMPLQAWGRQAIAVQDTKISSRIDKLWDFKVSNLQILIELDPYHFLQFHRFEHDPTN